LGITCGYALRRKSEVFKGTGARKETIAGTIGGEINFFLGTRVGESKVKLSGGDQLRRNVKGADGTKLKSAENIGVSFLGQHNPLKRGWGWGG